MRRSPVALVVLVAVALTASACGSSGKSSDTSSPATTGGSGDSGAAAGGATAVLKAIDTTAATGAQKLKLDLGVDIKGSPTNAQLALFTKQPIDLTVDGVVDAGGKGADVNVSVTLGKDPIKAEIRTGGGKSWLQIDGKWYDLPADALSSTTGQSLPTGASASNLDAGKILAAIGDPSKLLDNATVSSEKVEGVDSDKVSGDVNITAAAAAFAKLSTSVGSSSSAPSPAEIDKSVAELQKVIKKAHVDLWVGKSDHKVHRLAFTADAAMDDATKTSSGIDSVTLNLDVTSVDADAPDVSAPSSVGTPAELQTALIGLLGKVMGGAATG
jgi:hypothetical protein